MTKEQKKNTTSTPTPGDAVPAFQRRYHLTNGPGGLGLSCTSSGLSLAGAPLLCKTDVGFFPRPPEEIEALIGAAYGGAIDPSDLSAGLDLVAEALNHGDEARAKVAALHLRLSDLDWETAARLARVQDALVKYDPNEPRDWHGRWTGDDGSAPAAGQFEEAGDRVYPWVTDFRNKHLSDATKLAAIIGHGSTVGEVLAASGAESSYGRENKATLWGNFFGIHAAGSGSYFPGQVDIENTSGGQPMAVFRPSDGFWFSGLVFANKMAKGAGKSDLSDPKSFFSLTHSLGWGTTNSGYFSLVLGAYQLIRNSARATERRP